MIINKFFYVYSSLNKKTWFKNFQWKPYFIIYDYSGKDGRMVYDWTLQWGYWTLVKYRLGY